MSTRNKDIIIEIVQTLDDLVTSPHEAKKRLEAHYANSLIVVVSTTQEVPEEAVKFRMPQGELGGRQ